MKKLMLILSLVTIIAMTASCGDGNDTKKSVEMGKPFEHELFTITLAKDWEGSEEKDGPVIIKKSDTEGMVIMAADNNTESVDAISKNISEQVKQQNPNAKLSEITEVKFGEYTFKKIVGTDADPTTKKEVSMYVLVTTKDSIGMVIQLSNLEGEEEQAMLQTLKIK